MFDPCIAHQTNQGLAKFRKPFFFAPVSFWFLVAKVGYSHLFHRRRAQHDGLDQNFVGIQIKRLLRLPC